MILNEKGIVKEFDLVVYPFNLVAVVGSVEEEVNKQYLPLDEGYDKIVKPRDDADGSTYHVKNRETNQTCLLIWSPTLEDCKGYIICHEAGHASLDLFNFIGAENILEDQEPFCYLLCTIYRLFVGAYQEYKEFIDKSKSKTSKKK